MMVRVLIMYYFGIVVLPASDPKDLFIERVTM
jgi:hypothetical protein